MFRLITTARESQPPPFGVAKGLSSGVIIASGAVAILALHTISFLAQMIATPIIFGICVGMVTHIALYGPKESIECAKELLQKTLKAIERLIANTPLVLHQIAGSAKRISQNALQTIGRRFNPPAKTSSIRELAKELVLEGRSLAQKAHKKSTPIIRKYVSSSWKFVKDSSKKL